MTRVYLMPMIGGTNWMTDPRRPKYRDTYLSGLLYRSMDYGPEDVCIVAVQDPPAQIHSALAA
jgi:hypothetical protein